MPIPIPTKLTPVEIASFQKIFFEINDIHISPKDAEWLGLKLVDMMISVLYYSDTYVDKPHRDLV
ncbi:MAG: hypothetical protein KDE33_05885 [Bacteroidetes bacterium]|nr:hypothetical protein [Bacteroidota bacterium]